MKILFSILATAKSIHQLLALQALFINDVKHECEKCKSSSFLNQSSDENLDASGKDPIKYFKINEYFDRMV